MTESDREEAFRAREIALMKMEDRDFIGAQKIILKAQKRFPELDNVPQLLTICKVHCAAESRVNGVMDWYAILQAEAGADEAVIRKQYRKLAFSLHPDKNSFAGAEAAFKLVAEACSVLCDREKRSQYDLKMRKASRKAARPRQEPSNMNDANEGSETTFWTVCPRCETRYRYYSCVLNSRVRCQQCERNFFAKEHYVPTSSNSDISSEQGHPEQPSSPSSVDGGGSTDTSHSTDECPLTHATGPGVSDPTAEDWLRDTTRPAERLRESPEETNQSVHVARTDTTDECPQTLYTVTDTWATGPHVSDPTAEGSDRLAERLREKPEEAKQSVHVARTQLAASIPIRPSLPREEDKTPRSNPSMAAAGDGEPMEVDQEIEVATVLCDLKRTLQARKRKRRRRGDASSWGRRRRWSVLQDGVPSDAGVAQRNGTASPDTPLAFRDSSVPEEPLNENRVKAPSPKKKKKSVPEDAAAKKSREQEQAAAKKARKQEQAREKADADAKKAREKAEADAKKAREKVEAAVKKAEAAAAQKARLKEEAAKKAREKAEAAVKRAEAAAAEKARLKEEAAAKKAREKAEAKAKKAREKAEAATAKRAREKAEAEAKKAREQAEAAAKKAREEAAVAAAKKAREEAEAAAKKAREQAEADAKKAREEEEAEAEEDKVHQEWVQKQSAVIASLSQESTDLVKEIKAHKIRLLRLWYRNQSLKEKRKAWQQEQARKMWEEERKRQEEEARKIREKEEEARKTLERLEQARKARQQEEQERKMREQQKQARRTRRSRRQGTAVPDPEPDPKETTVPNPVPEPKEIDAEAREARRRRLEKLRAKTGTRRGGG